MVNVHQGIVLAGNIGECSAVFLALNIPSAVVLPRLELVVKPVCLGSFQRNGVEHVESV